MRATHRWLVNSFVILGFSVLFVTGTHAQINAQLAVEQESIKTGGPLCGTTLLIDEQQMVRDYLAANPGVQEKMRLQKNSAWDFVVGSQRNWFAYDFSDIGYYSVPSTCRAVGANCYIFVEDAIWGTRVTQAGVDTILYGFDSRTPANPTKGIYTMDVEAFGSAPDVDGDPRIIILILDIKDFYSGGGGSWIAGYYSSLNQTNMANSNQAEFYYVDANPTNILTDEYAALGTAAHEFQHLIHDNYDNNEITFINEACSMVAEVHCGYGIFFGSGYVNETNRNLLSWRPSNDPDVVIDYSRAARFMTYLRDQFGIGLMKQIVIAQANAAAGLDAAFQAHGTPLRFNDVFVNWLIANILDDRSVDPAYGYIYPNLPKAVGNSYDNPNVSSTNGTVQPLAAEYLSYRFGSDLRTTFNFAANTTLMVKAVEIGPSAARVLDVAPNTEFHEPEFGTTYSQVHFVVMNSSQGAAFSYSFQSSGNTASAIELKWDETEPVGLFGDDVLSPSDTVCVVFNGVAGGRLDSVRIALRRAGSITGGVWEHTGVLRPTPLGNALSAPFTATVTGTPPVPYPVPWPNWATIDLRSQNIETDTPFTVGLIIGASALTPGVMLTTYPGDSPYNSFTYLHDSPANWYFISNSEQGVVFIYLIRAYVSLAVGVSETIELSPASFALAQNYPNPFNPGTKIKFSLPQTGHATLRIYNMLGQEVATLLDSDLLAGPHEIDWRPAGLPSGVYTYRLQAGEYSESKQLLLLK